MNKKLFLVLYEQSVFGDLTDHTLEMLLEDACSEGLNDGQKAAIGYISVANLLSPLLQDQVLLAGLVAENPAYKGLPIVGINNACDSGGLAVIDAAKAVLSGQTNVAMAVGVEKMNIKKEVKPEVFKTDSIRIGRVLGTAGHLDDGWPPFTFPHIFGRIMKAYLKKYAISEERFAQLPPYLYTMAAYNPLAHMYQPKHPVTPESVIWSGHLFHNDNNRYEGEDLPLKLQECSQVSDGYARIVVCDGEGLQRLCLTPDDATVLAGWGHAVDGISLESRGNDLLLAHGARAAFQQATRMAKIPPESIGAMETHDCFTVMLPLTAEIIDRAKPGQGLEYFLECMTGPESGLPTNTSGGLIAKGHPIAATGIAQVGWIHEQILGQVPKELQVPDCENGVTLNIGGPICSTVCTAQYRARA